MRNQGTISALERWRPSTSLRRVSAGTLSLKKARTSSRNAISSLLKARSIGSSCVNLRIYLFVVPANAGTHNHQRPRIAKTSATAPKATPRGMGPGVRRDDDGVDDLRHERPPAATCCLA